MHIQNYVYANKSSCTYVRDVHQLPNSVNIELIKYDKHSPTNEFLDSLSLHVILPNIIQPKGNTK